MSEDDEGHADITGGLSEDWFLGGALVIAQPRRGYRAGLDAVLLAAAAPVSPSRRERVADVGAGVGTVGLAVARRVETAEVVLIERDADLAGIAAANIRRNALAARVTAVRHDVEARNLAPGLTPDSFDHALANPPYFAAEAHREPAHPLKAGARVMPAGGLETWARFLARIVRPGGTATLIYPVAALGGLVAAMEGRFGALKIKPIHPREGAPAGRVLIQGTKGSRAPLELRPPLVVHAVDGSFLAHAKRLSAEPAALEL